MARVRGGALIKRRVRVIQRNVRAAVSVALDDAADDLLARATAIAPQLTGDLIDSGEVRSKSSRTTFTRIVSFDTPYALRMHEDFYNLGPISSQKSATSDGPIGRKFLSRPFDRNGPRYVDDIGKAVAKAIRQSVR